jgi:hypothetical protein
LLKAAIALGVLVYVLMQVDLREALTALARADYRFVAIAFGSAFIAMTLNVRRWQMMLAAQGMFARLGTLVRLYLISMFFNNVTPGRFGGDVIRAYLSSRLGASRPQSIAAILMDRLVGGIAVLMLGVIGVVANPSVIPFQLGYVMLAMLGVSMLILFATMLRSGRLGWLRELVLRLAGLGLWGRWLRPRVEAMIEAVRIYARSRVVVVVALLISLLANGISVVNLYWYSVAVGADVSLWDVAVLAPVILAIGLLPISINGIGTIELAFVVLYGALGVDSAIALAVALLRRLALLLLSLIGGGLWVGHRFN